MYLMRVLDGMDLRVVIPQNPNSKKNIGKLLKNVWKGSDEEESRGSCDKETSKPIKLTKRASIDIRAYRYIGKTGHFKLALRQETHDDEIDF